MRGSPDWGSPLAGRLPWAQLKPSQGHLSPPSSTSQAVGITWLWRRRVANSRLWNPPLLFSSRWLCSILHPFRKHPEMGRGTRNSHSGPCLELAAQDPISATSSLAEKARGAPLWLTLPAGAWRPLLHVDTHLLSCICRTIAVRDLGLVFLINWKC